MRTVYSSAMREKEREREREREREEKAVPATRRGGQEERLQGLLDAAGSRKPGAIKRLATMKDTAWSLEVSPRSNPTRIYKSFLNLI